MLQEHSFDQPSRNGIADRQFDCSCFRLTCRWRSMINGASRRGDPGNVAITRSTAGGASARAEHAATPRTPQASVFCRRTDLTLCWEVAAWCVPLVRWVGAGLWRPHPQKLPPHDSGYYEARGVAGTSYVRASGITAANSLNERRARPATFRS